MGKPKYIETPEKMERLFDEYVAKIKGNPRTKIEYVGRNGDKVETPLETPLTMVGFENFVFDAGFNTELSQYFANRDERYTDYVPICSRIRGKIREDQISGGMVGQYNASITQRLNGLAENSNLNHTGDASPFNALDLDVPEDNGSE